MTRMVRAIDALCVVMCAVTCAACASDQGGERVSPDDAKATASVDALEQVHMCNSTYDDVAKALGEPYRDGVAHQLRVVSWKVTPSDTREPTPLSIAFQSNIAVDICYDLPAMISCEMRNRCEGP